jgi:hypothetical protein
MVAVAGLTMIATKTGAVTVRVAVPCTPLRAAVMVTVLPLAGEVRPVATPLLPAAFDTWATAMLLDDQVT